MQLYFIRHAQSTNNDLWARTGGEVGRAYDPDLTATGRRQAELLAAHLGYSVNGASVDERDMHNRAGYGLTHLYCSLMQRAVITGRIVAERLGQPLQAWPEWHESGGLYLEDEATNTLHGQAGPNRAELLRQFPGLVLPDSVGEGGWWNRPFEEREACLLRAQHAVAELRARHGETHDRVGIVSHGAFYNYVLAAILNLPAPKGFWFSLHNTAISRVDFTAERTYLVYQNRVDHLPLELIT
jgi:2,3-bisphosphoglycerate-dependent phosphoglycerate mutase